MPPWLFIALAALLALSAGAAPTAVSPESSNAPPNVLLIVLDDFGFNDLGANGNPNTPTPNMDALAAQGVLYTRHYADASCSVARVALMTGTFPARHGLRPNHLGLSAGTPTIATMLQARGYRTQHIGKWHIVSATLDQSPSHFGFDNWYGFLHNNELGGPSENGIDYQTPTYKNPWLRDNQSPLRQESGHLTNILTARAIAFLDEQKEKSQPWFLNLWYYAPHSPIQPADNFRGKYPDTPEGAYHALIDQLDSSIGRVIAALDRNGDSENTLVILVSDNGGTNRETDNNHPFTGGKTWFTEGGLRTPLIMRWPGHIQPNGVSGELVSIMDILPTIAQATAAAPPTGLVGRSLLDSERGELPALYWEYSNSQRHQYSILSQGGRWRLTDYFGWRWLVDLDADPSGKGDVLSQYPEIAEELTNDYLHWHRRMRKVTVNYEPLNSTGGALLSGNDLQRSPGYSGFTFAIGVTPPEGQDDKPGVIAEQAGRWRLWTSAAAGLRLNVLGQEIEVPALRGGQCSEVVVSSFFNFSPFPASANFSYIDLYINGERAGHLNRKHPMLKTADYANPTYVGMNPGGEEVFRGRLGKPVILNERVVPDEDGKVIGNGISGVPSTCPAQRDKNGP